MFTAYADGDSALSQRIDTTNARVGGVEAGLVTEQKARADAVSAQADRTTQLIAQTNSDRAYFLSSETARISAEGGLATRLDSLVVQTNADRGYFLNEQTARIGNDNTFAQQIQEVYARTDAGTAAGRIKFEAVSAPGGVTARFGIQLSTERSGQYANASFFMDILPDGQRRTVFDANLIAFTANGGLSYPFTFDGQTLRVPNLILTSGQAATPMRADIGSYTLVAGPGTLNSAIDANLNFVFRVTNPDFPSVINLFGKLTVSGPNTSLLGMRILIDDEMAGFIQFNGNSDRFSGGTNPQAQFFGQCVRYLPAGDRRVRIQYSYTSTDGGGRVQIDELHIAGFTPRA
ncbi:hypothetical protein ASF33_09920 [Methylobacterium sp. Leaf92]|nr:hypothetical protein ASF33_09920 [Methylobacterium sp. Leaf92]